MPDKESPAQLHKRADTLRTCARQARHAAHEMGTYLDREAKQASGTGDDLIWIGPYATDTTGTLQARKSALHRMASDLIADARRWETEAMHLEEKANGKSGAR
ncbi:MULTISPECIES: hypothetical protein [unclassified Streptomyces]|uniref:hypothetical protein n=1 Tax=unclassified Streptomyces TaxID=2593676 RepID=UPI002E10B180|nr:hypothetical protein OG452_16270 [Streptomyces sp. NBC_01197]WSS50576.1 hypothetical protein OG708_19250 [Streptomyces sp. NBC_01180]